MAWIKRNLMLVIGGVVAVVLLTGAVLFLMDRLKQDAASKEELEAKVAAFEDLHKRPVHPGSDKVNNIAAAKEDSKALLDFIGKERAVFGPPISTNRLNNKEFRALLDVTIDLLQREAERAGVALPQKDYWFTFAAQKNSVEFAPATLAPLAIQLSDIKEICQVLYRSRVTGISTLKRIPVAKEDSGPLDYTGFKAVTNELAVITPYEVVFQGFSSELEHVLEGLAASQRFFIVKNVAVEHAIAGPGFGVGGVPPEGAVMPRVNFGEEGPRRPIPGRPMIPQARRGGLTTVLDEEKLRFQLRIDVVKLKPAK